MPIYEYLCNSCNSEFEEIVFDQQNPPCTSCGSMNTQKLMSRPSNYTSGSANGEDSHIPSSAGSGCGGCSGGNCATCK